MIMSKKSKKIILASILLMMNSVSGMAQSIRGVVTEATTGEPVIGATVFVKELKKGSITNMDGEYSFSDLPPGRYTIEASYVGFTPYTINEVLVAGNKEQVINMEMSEATQDLKEIVVRPDVKKEKAINHYALVGVKMISMEEAARFAGGYSDPARLVTSFAGVAGSPDNNGISVHGNAPQSLSWRLEGVEINSPNHFTDAFYMGAGAVSALNANMLANSDFYSGAMTAEYGNALSGVMDMKLRKGNDKNYQHALQLGTLGVEGTSEGPISKKAGSSYLINYRYSFTTLSRKIGLLELDGDQADFQDLCFKLNFPTTKAGTFSVFALAMQDKYWLDDPDDPSEWCTFYDREQMESRQRMLVGGLSHSIYLGKGFNWSTTVAGSYFQNDGEDEYYDPATVSPQLKYGKLMPYMEMRQKNSQYTFTTALQKRFSERFTSKVGVTYSEYYFDLGLRMTDIGQPLPDDYVYRADSHTGLLTAYLSNSWKMSTHFTFNFGLTTQHFRLNKETTVEPRAALQWNPNYHNTFSLGYGLHSKMEKMDVYFYKDPVNGFVNKGLDLSKAHHLLLSWMYRFNDHLNLKAEAYYQWLYDIPVGAGNSEEDKVYCVLNRKEAYVDRALKSTGKGRNYGFDLTLEQYMHNGWFGMINGSIYKAEYQAANGEWYNTRYNRGYLAKVLGGKEWMFGKNNRNIINVSAKCTVQGGTRHTPVDLNGSKQWYEAGDPEVKLINSKAWSEQYDPLVMFDLTVSYKFTGKGVDHTFAIEALNITGEEPPYADYYDYKNDRIKSYDSGLSFPNIYYRISF